MVYIGSNVTNVKAEQLRESVSEALKEGGAIMGTAFQELFDRGKEVGLKEGEERGEERGEEKKAIRMALNCLMKGMDIWTVAELTELSVERIESLKAAIRQENSSRL
ncbi:MAG TPA: hypothetical protein VK186_16420 [Candidatus Deferrimicrobium sp.]|nr:hypothetical protein [Candidatus Deferrimicrobium sp.]